LYLHLWCVPVMFIGSIWLLFNLYLTVTPVDVTTNMQIMTCWICCTGFSDVGGLPECFLPVAYLLQNLSARAWIFALRLAFLNFCINSCHTCLYDSPYNCVLSIATLSSALSILLDYPEKENNSWNYIKMDVDFMNIGALLNKP
jgi:hypothetical protein